MITTIGQAAGMFAVTNVDDLVLLAIFFARARAWHVVAGQYLGFAGILPLGPQPVEPAVRPSGDPGAGG